MADIGQNICRQRLKMGMTQERLAALSGVSQPNLSAIEKGRRDLTVSTLRRIALALEVSAGQLLESVSPPGASDPMSRPRIERIARLALASDPTPDDADGRAAELFRHVLAAPGSRRRPAKRMIRSWMEIRSRFEPAQVRAILERIHDQALRVA